MRSSVKVLRAWEKLYPKEHRSSVRFLGSAQFVVVGQEVMVDLAVAEGGGGIRLEKTTTIFQHHEFRDRVPSRDPTFVR